MPSSARSTRPATTRTTRSAASHASRTTGPPMRTGSQIWCGICGTTTSTCAAPPDGSSTAARSRSTLSRPALCVAFEGSCEALQQRALSLQQLHLRVGHGKPTGPVDFGEFTNVARPFRPFEFEGVAERALEVEVAAYGER